MNEQPISVYISPALRQGGAPADLFAGAEGELELNDLVIVSDGGSIFRLTGPGFDFGFSIHGGNLVLVRNGCKLELPYSKDVPFNARIAWTPVHISLFVGAQGNSQSRRIATPHTTPSAALVTALTRPPAMAEPNVALAIDTFSTKLEFRWDGKPGVILSSTMAAPPDATTQQTQTITGMAATCGDCGAIFRNRGQVNVSSMVSALQMSGAGVCPKCGGRVVFDELYGVLEDGIHRMTDSGFTFDQVSTLIQILRAAVDRKETDVSAVTAEIKIKAPEQTGAIEWLNRVAPTGSMLIGFLSLVVAALALVLTLHQQPTPSAAEPPKPTVVLVQPSPEEVKIAVAEAIAALKAQAAPPQPAQSAVPPTVEHRDENPKKGDPKKPPNGGATEGHI